MHPQTVENCSPNVQQTPRRLDADPDAFQEILQTIEHCEDSAGENRSSDLNLPAHDPSADKVLFHQDDLIIEETKSDFKPQDSVMNTDTNLYSYASSTDPSVKSLLTQRLYPSSKEPQYTPNLSRSLSPLEELKRLVDENNTKLSNEMRNDKLNEQSHELDIAIQNFHGLQSRTLSDYYEQWKNRKAIADYCLHIFHGWNEQPEFKQNIFKDPSQATRFLLSQNLRKSTGGHYLRWNNKGIVINPGKHFMQNFHCSGLHIKDIDFVISTQGQPETYSDIREIYELNSQLNKVSAETHVIQYYLNQAAYQDLSSLLKTNSKQERRAFHCLEFFIDSPDVERVELGAGIHLNYFSIAAPAAVGSPYSRLSERNTGMSSILGIRLELSLPQELLRQNEEINRSGIHLGYISGSSWSPFTGRQLAKCDVLLAGIGSTNHHDYNKIAHMDDCLGYFGVCSLMEEASPKLLMITEFAGKDGDIRLEMIKKMRCEYAQKKPASHEGLTILPTEKGLFVDLKTLRIKCSLTGELVDASAIRVVRSAGSFGPLHYISSACCL